MKDRKTVRARSRMEIAGDTHKAGGKLGRDIQSKIGQQLRAHYDDVVNQGVPDRFADLLRRLDPADDGEQGLGKAGDDKAQQ